MMNLHVMQNWPLITNNEIHQHSTRIEHEIYIHLDITTCLQIKHSDNLVHTRQCISPDNVFHKLNTHSLNGIKHYVKLHYVKQLSSCSSSRSLVYRGEAGLLITPKYGYFRNLLPLISVVGLFSPLFFLLCLSQISLHAVLPSS